MKNILVHIIKGSIGVAMAGLVLVFAFIVEAGCADVFDHAWSSCVAPWFE